MSKASVVMCDTGAIDLTNAASFWKKYEGYWASDISTRLNAYGADKPQIQITHDDIEYQTKISAKEIVKITVFGSAVNIRTVLISDINAASADTFPHYNADANKTAVAAFINEWRDADQCIDASGVGGSFKDVFEDDDTLCKNKAYALSDSDFAEVNADLRTEKDMYTGVELSPIVWYYYEQWYSTNKYKPPAPDKWSGADQPAKWLRTLMEVNKYYNQHNTKTKRLLKVEASQIGSVLQNALETAIPEWQCGEWISRKDGMEKVPEGAVNLCSSKLMSNVYDRSASRPVVAHEGDNMPPMF